MALDRSPELRLATTVMASMAREMPIKSVCVCFLFLPLAAIMFTGAEPF